MTLNSSEINPTFNQELIFQNSIAAGYVQL